MEIHMPKFGPHRHNGSPPRRDALRQAQRAIVLGTHPQRRGIYGPGLTYTCRPPPGAASLSRVC